MARRFAKVSEEEIEEAFFYPSDLVNTKTTIPRRVGEERWIYTQTRSVKVYIHHYSPPLRGIVVYYFLLRIVFFPDAACFLELVKGLRSIKGDFIYQVLSKEHSRFHIPEM